MELYLLSPVGLHDLMFNETQGNLYVYLKFHYHFVREFEKGYAVA
jgi:hypothetical protein